MLTAVLTHYRMPEARLREFFQWNADLFREFGVRVIVVVDGDQGSGFGDRACGVEAQLLAYPRELKMFSLSSTSNFGIRAAGAGIVCKTDPDCVFTRPVLERMAQLDPGEGLAPLYCMAPSFAEREAAWDYHLARLARTHRAHPLHGHYGGADSVWKSSSGTLALHFSAWEQMRGYDERMEGYGIEDGIALRRAQAVAGVAVSRPELPFFHIAHTGAPQAHGNLREDCWGRNTASAPQAFNPPNHRQNRRVLKAAQAGLLPRWQEAGAKTWGTGADFSVQL